MAIPAIVYGQESCGRLSHWKSIASQGSDSPMLDMGSPSQLTADALMTICSSLTQSTPWLYIRNVDPLSALPFVLVMLSIPTALAVYGQIQRDSQPRQIQSPKLSDCVPAPADPLSRQESIKSQDQLRPHSVSTSTSESAKRTSESLLATEEQQLQSSSAEAWMSYSDTLGKISLNTPPSSPLSSKQWSPRLSRGLSDSTRTDSGNPAPTAQVHVHCTHVEQKNGKNGLISSITRPSYHIPVAQFPQLQTTFSASSERAFFNNQQDLSPSPILRDSRYLDLQYRLSAVTDPQAPGEVNFDEIISTIRRNKKTNQDTTIYVHVIRVKEVIPCVTLTYIYHGHQNRSDINTTATHLGEEVPQSTRIVDFKIHLVRVKHLSPNTLLWDCARHVAKSVKQDHAIILQTRDLYVEIFAQDLSHGDPQSIKMTTPETVKDFVRDKLPGLLQKHGNVVPLRVSVYKKAPVAL